MIGKSYFTLIVSHLFAGYREYKNTFYAKDYRCIHSLKQSVSNAKGKIGI